MERPTLKTILLAAAAIPMFAVSAAQAQSNLATQSRVPDSWEPIQLFAQATAPAPKKASTSEYVRKAALGDMFEIESSKLAIEKAKNKDVKDFASKMVSEHTKTTDEIKDAVAKAKVNVTPPTQLDADHAAKLEQLRAANGPAFDRLYVSMQSEAHAEALKLHKDYADTGDNAELKKAADDISGHVKTHLEDIMDIQRSQNL